MNQITKPVNLSIIICSLFFASCTAGNNTAPATETTVIVQQINSLLDSFNVAAARADYNGYFNLYTEDAIFTGTDATERWNKKEFMIWAKPIFARGHAWSFTSIERHIYTDKTGNLAWFDELLNTQMKICRGSGVLVKQGNEWKVQQYILSATVPNNLLDSIIRMKTPAEDSIIQKIVPAKKA